MTVEALSQPKRRRFVRQPKRPNMGGGIRPAHILSLSHLCIAGVSFSAKMISLGFYDMYKAWRSLPGCRMRLSSVKND